MSYCRFSSDDWKCDVYVFPDVRGGITTYVAANRIAPVRPMPPRVDESNVDAWVARMVEVSKIAQDSPHVPLGLAHDGEEYFHQSPEEAADRLEVLRKAGYNVPEDVIECLRGEACGT